MEFKIGVIMNMRLILLLFSTMLISCGLKEKKEIQNVNVQLNVLTEQEIADGWQLLFDGTTFNNWRGIGIDSIPKGHWEIRDSCIRKIKSGDVPLRPDGQPLKGGDLMTDKTFDNFEFSFEWKISEGGNSGVKYNVIEEISIERGSSNALGFEYQVLDDEKNDDNLNPTHRSASLYDMMEAKNKTLKPVGEFNHSKIVFDKNHGEHWLNGVKVVEYNLDTPDFQTLYEKSKYSKIQDFIKHKLAHIVLQDHGSECWYRNLKIKEIK
jgi:hypothetical protein